MGLPLSLRSRRWSFFAGAAQVGLPLSRDGPAFCGRRSLDSFQRCSRSLAQLPRLAGGCFLAALCAQALVLPRAEGSFVLVVSC